MASRASRFQSCASRLEARRQYHAINKAHGLPRRGRHVGGGTRRAISDVEGGRGWVIEHARLAQIDGVWGVIVTDEDVTTLHGTQQTLRDDTVVTIDLGSTVEHTELPPERQVTEEPALPPERTR